MQADSSSASAVQGLESAGGAAGRGSSTPVETSGQSTTSREPAAILPGHRTAACESCRAGKLRCIKPSPTAEACSRCIRFNLECVYVPFRVGRKKGARNKSVRGPHQHQHRHQQQRRSSDSSVNVTGEARSILSPDCNEEPQANVKPLPTSPLHGTFVILSRCSLCSRFERARGCRTA